MNAPIPNTPPKRHRHDRAWSWLALILSLLVFCGVMLLAVLQWIILPNSQRVFDNFSASIRDDSGMIIRAGGVEGHLLGFNPYLKLTDLSIQINPHAAPIKADILEAELGWRIFLGELQFRTLQFVRLNISLERGADGVIRLAGIGQDTLYDPAAPSQGNQDLFVNWLEWLIRQPNVRIEDAAVHWRDLNPALRQRIDWDIRVNAGFAKQLSTSRFHAEINWPEEVAGIMKVDGRFQKLLVKDWFNSTGEMSVNLSQANWAALTYFLPEGEKWSGTTDTQWWWHGEGIHHSRMVIHAKAENLQWQAFPLNAARAEGQMIGNFDQGTLRLNSEAFKLQTNQGSAPLPTLMSMNFDAEGQLQGGEMLMPSINLSQAKKLLKAFVQWIPEASTLDAIKPTGTLSDSRFKFTLPNANTPTAQYQFSTSLNRVGWQAYRKLPGVSGLSGQLNATPAAGTLTFNSQNLVLQLPDIMHVPRHDIDSLTGELHWQIDSKSLPSSNAPLDFSLQFSPIHAANADGELELTGHFERVHGEPLIDINAILLNSDGRKVWRYLPKSVDISVQKWVSESLLGGASPLTHLTLRGNLKHFPFKPSQSIVPTEAEAFVTLVPFRDARIQFQPDWPPVEDAAGLLTFNGPELNVLVTRGTLAGANAEGITIKIANLDHPVLAINGTIKGDINQFKDFMLNSPLKEVIPGLANAHAEGHTELDLALSIPIDNAEHGTTVMGRLRSDHPLLSINDVLPPIKSLHQETQFDQNGVIGINAHGKWLDSPLTLTATADRGQVRFMLDNVPVDALKHEPNLQHPWLEALSGSIQAEGLLHFNQGFSLDLTANTEKLITRLPTPFQKPLGVNWPWRMSFNIPPKSTSLPTEHAMATTEAKPFSMIGNLYQSPLPLLPDNKTPPSWLELLAEWSHSDELPSNVHTILNQAPPPSPSTTKIRMRVQDPEALALPSISAFHAAPQGMDVQMSLRTWDYTTWLPWLSQLDQPDRGTAAPLFRQAQFQFDQATFGENVLHHVQGNVAPPNTPIMISLPHDAPERPPESWRVAFNSAETQGIIDMMPPNAETRRSTPSAVMNVNAQFDQIDLAPFMAQPSKALTPAKVDATQTPHHETSKGLPNLNFSIKAVRYKNLAMGAFNARAIPTPEGYDITEWTLSDGESTTVGTGKHLDNTNQSSIRFNSEIKRLDQKLSALNGKSQLSETNMNAYGVISWKGKFTDYSLPAADGEIALSLSKGRFLEIEPGVGRLIGLLSLQTIFRRITFDFSDSIKKGFSFDNIEGNMQLKAGELHFNDLTINSPAAKVLMQGRVGLREETQDMVVTVLPDISGGLSSGIAFFVSPITGIVTWLAQKIIGSPFDYVFARKLQVTGQWDEPEVKEIPYHINPSNPETPNTNAQSATLALSSPSLGNQDEPKTTQVLHRGYPDGFRAECR